MVDLVKEAIRSCYSVEGPEISDAGVGQGQTQRFVVLAAAGRFMAKLYGPTSSEKLEWVDDECSLLGHLKKCGQAVAAIVPSADGQPFVLIEGRPLLLYEWAEGSIEWPAVPKRAAKLGATLAEMHRVSDGLPLSGNERLYDIDRLVDRPLRLLQPYSRGIEDEFEELEKLLSRLRATIEAVPLTPQTFGPIHGDIHQGNCFFTDDGRVTLFDFALCGVGYRAYDLTGFLWPMRDEAIEDPEMRACCEAFLAGYNSVRRLTTEEEAAIPAFVQVRTLWETADWIDTGTGSAKPEEVANSIPHMVRQFESRG